MFPNLTYDPCDLNKHPNRFFLIRNVAKLILKYLWKYKRPRTGKRLSKNAKVEVLGWPK